ncbi:hypothetical protein DCAR_0623912 [Daucus carota subsp. sativus]|uniref:F-box domain-containing protein n=1 Tax=Daucus carota subsp. sativus TaxID=79200 RepID=A0AAF0XAJ0_DAUCS|nr:hypothetical protein DCAR_0623912 [Daucus carota subsp. sativus]
MAGAFDSEHLLAEILKRLPPKSLAQCTCVEKSWYDLIQSPYFKALYSDSNQFIYMLAKLFHRGFALYRMDPLLHPRFSSNSCSSDSTYLHDLRPLLVFPTDSHLGDNYFKCIKLGSKIYFYGLALSSGNKYTSFYTMEEKDLMSIEPSEDNVITNFKHLLTKIKNPMHELKLFPIVFVANDKLYVLSGCFLDNIFEVFSPADGTWQVLPNPEDDALEFHYYADGRVSYVCASKMTSRGEEFMQPYLAPDEAFLEVLRYSRFTYMFKQCSTDYIVAFQDSDGKQQLCIITYGCRPLEKRFSPYETTCYVALSFYDIPGDFYTSEDRHFHEPDVYASYADEKTKDGGVIRRYFSAKFLYTKHFIINNFSFGTIETCFL